ncbi:arylsulfatase [Thalassotalea psychrophila]|uniref:Arylsulfatase n=1 Tax=Thalassotalea psychrophila TaxID=3065647 RepID=A0ABY9TVE9_9GAMM|nr:arylsulfatase [Colwelliaceae bacterium SQ149]
MKLRIFSNKVKPLSILLVGLLAIAGCSQQESASEAKDTSAKHSAEKQPRPNIILVMTDDQGYGDFGMHNNPIVQTPILEELANESQRFTNFHVDPTCSPTRAALMSGKYSLRAGVWHTVMGRHMLNDQHHTLPEILSDAGYNTAMIGKWHLGDNYPFRPQDQGFDHVLNHGGGGVGQAPDYWENDQFDDTYFLNGKEKKYNGFATDVWFDEAIDFIHQQANKEAPFFLYLSTNAPHVPWRAPEQYIEPYKALGLNDDMAKFYGMITNIDDNIGRLRNAMRSDNIEDNTIFIFMTDNGSSMAHKSNGEPLTWLDDDVIAAIEAKTGKKLDSLNNYMRAGKSSTYEGGHRVPFFIRWPNGSLGQPGEFNDLTAHVDVLPTLLDLAGIDGQNIETDGISLVPALKEGSALPDRTLIVTNQRVLNPDPERPYSVMQSNWRYVHAEQTGGVELFDLTNDPGQTNDISAQHPEKVIELAQAYEQWWLHVIGKGTPTTRPVIGSEHENPSRLTGMDWLSPNTDQVPWWPGFGDDKWGKGHGWIGNEDKFMVSPWALKVAENGNYTLTLYLHDIPAKKVIGKSFAHLQLNGETITQPIAAGATSVEFKVPLVQGDIDIRAWFDEQTDDSALSTGLPAFYMYVEKQN